MANSPKKENIYIPERADSAANVAGHMFSFFITTYMLMVLSSALLGFTLTLPLFLIYTMLSALFMGFYLGFSAHSARWLRAGISTALFVVNAWFLFSSLPIFESPLFSGEGIFA